MPKSFDKNFQWGVIGSGPAGIAAVGELLDRGVSGKDILWLDPKFEVGDLGALWGPVSSNTSVDLFLTISMPVILLNSIEPPNLRFMN